MAQYGLTFRKTALFERGANPVIYGLSNRHQSLPSGNGGGPRIFTEEVLPELEQYRYVTYAPTGNKPIDWTHEREWRWPFNGDLSKYENELNQFGVVSDVKAIPSLSINTLSLTGIGVIVKTAEEATWVAQDILTLVDRGLVGQYHFHHILKVDELPPAHALYDPSNTRQAIDAATLNLNDFFGLPAREVHDAEATFADLVKEVENSAKPRGNAIGYSGCWLWFPESTHPFVRKLLEAKRIIVNHEGRYLAKLTEFDQNRPLDERERMAESLAKRVSATFDVETTYFSTLTSIAPDDVPFSVGQDFLEHRGFYNRA